MQIQVRKKSNETVDDDSINSDELKLINHDKHKFNETSSQMIIKKQDEQNQRNVVIYLTLLVIYQTISTQIIKYGKSLSNGQAIYISTSVIFMTEVCKVAMATIVGVQQLGAKQYFYQVYGFEYFNDMLTLAVPGFLYSIQNQLIFYAIASMDPITYKILYNMRIITTAICAVLMLNQKLSRQQWIAIFLNLIGIIMVEHQSKVTKLQANPFWGFVAVAISSCTSGFASVFFEKVIKKRNAGKPEANFYVVQSRMGTTQIIFTGIMMILIDYKDINEKGIFYGYNFICVSTIVLMGAGGILMGLVIKYTDNIIKSFAVSITIVFTFFLSYLIFDIEIAPSVYFGTYVVANSILIYNLNYEFMIQSLSFKMFQFFLITVTFVCYYLTQSKNQK